LPKGLTIAPVLEGTVKKISDSGPQPHVFAVVEVIARYNLVVPIEKLQVTKSAESAAHPDDGARAGTETTRTIHSRNGDDSCQ
jgi:hypothetical protein